MNARWAAGWPVERSLRRAAFLTVACVLLVPACSARQQIRAASTPTPAASRAPSVPASRAASVSAPSAKLCPPGSMLDCDLQRRIAAVEAYLGARPGTVGIVLRDRRTGAIWRNEYADLPVWTASTIKLAMVVDLFERSRAGRISLTAGDRADIANMLHSSDDDAADRLWFKFAGADHLAYNNDFPSYGLTSLAPQRGFSDYYPYWGFQKCTPADLDRLMEYVLTRLGQTDRSYIVGRLQSVATNQQWGVWASGRGLQPGNKDGWSLEQGGWVLNSVGFAGGGQRYTLAVMNSLNGQGGYDDGVSTDNRVAQLLLSGRS